MQSTGLSISAALSGHSLLQFYHHHRQWVPLLFCPHFERFCLFFQMGFARSHPSTDAHWNGTSSRPWLSGTVQRLHFGIPKLRRDTSKLMAFRYVGFITIFCASAKQSLELEREQKRCEAQILMRYIFSAHHLGPAPRVRPPSRERAGRVTPSGSEAAQDARNT